MHFGWHFGFRPPADLPFPSYCVALYPGAATADDRAQSRLITPPPNGGHARAPVGEEERVEEVKSREFKEHVDQVNIVGIKRQRLTGLRQTTTFFFFFFFKWSLAH